ncbi:MULTISPECIES: AbrB family transcriptional regulator [unclassified Aureimonas]|uniref:AbrB family transcriptional regulator n=1 Tax=unclassified Aureimonas TaxID=2615206 RepID=UPI0006FC3A64|nr:MULTISPECIES: AbrB family transcriptional regulator [unclassified Aureimonas]KQT60659.1 ammonia monooxygenase [Aureimonas sp. Leaf460]KQT68788.1 ammonia monooxygenase [Aureimonas sp. Leaf427]
MTRRSLAALAATLLIAASGGMLAWLVALPVAWLLGSAAAVSVASLSGLRTHIPQTLRDATFFVLGVQAGAGVTPDVLGQIALWPVSFAIQMAGVLLVILATYAFLRGVFGWNSETALFASVPGAMSFVLAAASDTKADMTRVTVVQSLRLLLLLGALVPVLAWLEGGDGIVPVARGVAGTPVQYLVLFLLCAGGAMLGHVSRLPGGLLLGALIVSAVLHATGAAPVAVPLWLSVPALVVLGATIGSRLKSENRRAMLQLLPASLGAFAIGLGISTAAAVLGVATLGIDFGKVALAYAPGALEALTVLAYQFDQDPAYVAAHHVVRFIFLALLVPVVAKRLMRGGGGGAEG